MALPPFLLGGLAAFVHLLKVVGPVQLAKVSALATLVPPAAIEDAARRAGDKAELRRYPRGHFDIYVGEGFEDSVRDQSAFFLKHLKR
ncbi:MAG: hypothetical protein Q7J29_02185 [Stagnimonas sp.]|nr:hypothetical protein [Stagnimonas sp.]